MVLDVSMVREDNVSSLWKTESQCKPLGFWSKSLPSTIEDYHHQKAVTDVLLDSGKYRASDHEIPRDFFTIVSIMSWVSSKLPSHKAGSVLHSNMDMVY